MIILQDLGSILEYFSRRGLSRGRGLVVICWRNRGLYLWAREKEVFILSICMVEVAKIRIRIKTTNYLRKVNNRKIWFIMLDNLHK